MYHILLIVLIISCQVCTALSRLKETALVVSSARYHYEITNFFACTLKSIGLNVHIWMHQDEFREVNVKFLSMCSDTVVQLPYVYDNVTQSDIERFGHLVTTYRDANIKIDEEYIKPSLKALVFVTCGLDMRLMRALNIVDSLVNRTKKLLMVNHHSPEIVRNIGICTDDKKCAVVSLADHVADFTMRTLFKKSPDHHPLVLPIYPVYRLPVLADNMPAASANQRRTILFQGKTHKRDVPGILQCLKNIMTKNNLSFDIKFVGRTEKPVTIPRDMHAYVQMLSRVGNDVFYQLLANSSFLSTYLLDPLPERYNETLATSSVPAALISGIPVVAPQRVLDLYPCLKSAPVHRSVSRQNDCESVEAAVLLSESDLSEMRREAVMCREYLSRRSRITLAGFIKS